MTHKNEADKSNKENLPQSCRKYELPGSAASGLYYKNILTIVSDDRK